MSKNPQPAQVDLSVSNVKIPHISPTNHEDDLLTVKAQDDYANASPLGYIGFGLTFFLYGLSQASVYPLNSAVLAMGLCCGGFVQSIGGIFEMIKGKEFTAVSFLCFGAFWFSNVFIYAFLVMKVGAPLDKNSHALFFLLWSLLSLTIFIGSLRNNHIAMAIFGSSTIMFILLSGGIWGECSSVIIAGGVFGTITGIFAIYHAIAETINDSMHRIILPLIFKRCKSS